MHKPQCTNHDLQICYKVGLLGIRYTTTGQKDVHRGRTSRNYQPNLRHHKGSPLAQSTWFHTPVAKRVLSHLAVTQLVPRSSITQEDHILLQRLTTKVPRPSITQEEQQTPLGTSDHQLSKHQPEGFPSYGSLSLL
eukprot:Gb_07743 [translate_table: standard]